MTTRLRALVMFALLVAGCVKKDNPNYCPGLNADNNCAEGDAGIQPCTDNSQCSPPAALCDTQAKKCVQCTMAQTSACTDTTPICGADERCHGCASHADCPASNVCLPDGACAKAAEVAYVAVPGGPDNPMCSMATPCAKIMTALATNRLYVKLNGMFDEAVTIKDRNVTVLADPGTVLTRGSPGNILTIDGMSNAKIYDLAINGASGGAGISLPTGARQSVTLNRVSMSNNGMDAINVAGGSLDITESTISGSAGVAIRASGGIISIAQSTISGNAGGAVTVMSGTANISRSKIFENAGGGISITSGQFDIENNFITGNGNLAITMTYGGVLLNQTNTGTRILSFNTISANRGGADATTGVVCSLVTQDLAASNNIIYGNAVSGVGTQVGGAHCLWTYSDIGPDAVPGNVSIDPGFAPGDFHLQSSSPLINQADPNATLGLDIDGDVRPQGGRRDIGADEYTPAK